MKLSEAVAILLYFLAVSSFSYGLPKELDEKFLNRSYMGNLQGTVEKCIGAGTLAQGTCVFAEYLFHLKYMEEQYTRERSKGKSERVPKIDTVSDLASYPLIFEQYITKKRPFKGSVRASDQDLAWSTAELVEVVIANCHRNTLEEFPLVKCSDYVKNIIQDLITVPRFAANSYLRRVKLPAHLADETDEDDQGLLLSYIKNWPVIQVIEAGEPTPAAQCPAHMHQIIGSIPTRPGSAFGTGATDSSESSSSEALQLQVRLFPFRTSAAYFERSYNLSKPLHVPQFRWHGFPEVAPFQPEDSAATIGGSAASGADAGAQAEASMPDPKQLPWFSETSIRLDGSDYLFIPNRYLWSANLIGAGEEGSDEETSASAALLSICVMDASNLNLARDALHWGGLVRAQEAALLEQLSGGAAGLDLSMRRDVTDLTLRQFWSDPQAPALPPLEQAMAGGDSGPGGMAGGDSKKEEVLATPKAAATPNHSPPSSDRRDRRKKNKRQHVASSGRGGGDHSGLEPKTASNSASGGGGIFKEWQAAKKWNLQMTALTLPQPVLLRVPPPHTSQQSGHTATPVPVAAAGGGTGGGTGGSDVVSGRTNATIGWYSFFVPAPADKTHFAFRIAVCSIDPASPPTLEPRTAHGAAAATNMTMTAAPLLQLRQVPFDLTVPPPASIFASPDGLLRSCFVREVSLQSAVLTQLDGRPLKEGMASEEGQEGDGRRGASFQATLDGLQPGTLYQVAVTLVYDESASPQSQWSAPFRTHPLSAPAPPAQIPKTILRAAAVWPAGVVPSVSEELNPCLLAVLQAPATSWQPPSLLPGKTSLPSQPEAAERKPHLALIFGWPTDDGGSPILGYHVFARSVLHAAGAGSSGSGRQRKARRGQQASGVDGGLPLPPLPSDATDWRWLGAFRATHWDELSVGSLGITNLLPDKDYQFKLVSFNRLGNSSDSTQSNVVRFHLPQEWLAHVGGSYRHVFHGPGHKEHLSEMTAELQGAQMASPQGRWSSGEVEATAGAAGTALVSLDLCSELLYLSFPGAAEEHRAPSPGFAVWRSHWTSPWFCLHLHSALVLADPPQLHQLAAHNAADMDHRVVFALRGRVPFADKALAAQRAGAAALVIVDDGACRAYDQACLPGANKHLKEGFGAIDAPSVWNHVRIPVFFILKGTAIDIFDTIASIYPQSNLTLKDWLGETDTNIRDEL